MSQDRDYSAEEHGTPTFDEKLTAWIVGEIESLSPEDIRAIEDYARSEEGAKEIELLRGAIVAVRAATPTVSQLASERREALLAAARGSREPANASRRRARPMLALCGTLAAAAAIVAVGLSIHNGFDRGPAPVEVASNRTVESFGAESAFSDTLTVGTEFRPARSESLVAGSGDDAAAERRPERDVRLLAARESAPIAETVSATPQGSSSEASNSLALVSRKNDSEFAGAAPAGEPRLSRPLSYTGSFAPPNDPKNYSAPPLGLERLGANVEREVEELKRLSRRPSDAPVTGPEATSRLFEGRALGAIDALALGSNRGDTKLMAESLAAGQFLKQAAPKSGEGGASQGVAPGGGSYTRGATTLAESSSPQGGLDGAAGGLEGMQLASGSNPTATDSIDPKSEKKEEENRRGLSKDSRAGLAEGEAIKADASESRVEHDEAAEQQGDSTSPTLEDASRSIADASEGTTLEMTADPAAEAEAAKEAAARQARELVDAVLTELDRRPGETPSTMFFRHWGDNPFVEAESDPQSTFGLDVDTASYTLTRAYLFERGVLPPPEAIRTEEFVNRFDYGLAPPEEGRDFRIETNLGPSIFAHEPTYKLLAIGVRARDVEKAERKPASLVFVIDTSGSMRQENRLELVKDGLRLLVPELGEGDSVGIVAFDSEAHVILEPTSADQKERILDAIARLQPNHSTNVDAGLRAGYTMASQSRFANGTNRVLLLSDGVANTGVTVADQMLERVAEHRRQGIYLTTVGVGMGNHNDALLERLADRGNGQAIYVDRVEEARRVFVENLTGTLETVARDARIQVEFDSKKVLRYRLLGYENRAIADHRFRDDTVDAGEIGAGHQVVALYEIEPRPDVTGTLATVRLRWIQPEHGEAIEFEAKADLESAIADFDAAPARFRLAALVAELAEILRDSYWARGSRLHDVAARAEALVANPGELGSSREELAELVAMMKRADALVEERRTQSGEIAGVVDTLKETMWQRSTIECAFESPDQAMSDADRRHLEELIARQEELRGRLETMLIERQ